MKLKKLLIKSKKFQSMETKLKFNISTKIKDIMIDNNIESISIKHKTIYGIVTESVEYLQRKCNIPLVYMRNGTLYVSIVYRDVVSNSIVERDEIYLNHNSFVSIDTYLELLTFINKFANKQRIENG